MIFSQKTFASIGVLVAVSFLITSCSKKQPDSYLFGQDLEKAAKIFSTRPQLQGNTILMLKLSQPALLSALKTDKLKNVIDKELSKAIHTEQEGIIAQLKQINPQILVLYRYKMVMNGLTIVAPYSDLEKIQSVRGISMVKRSQNFDRPKALTASPSTKEGNLLANNSALFIGAKAAIDKNIKGQNIKIGIIDTGVDYTHAMLGGSGDPADFEKNKPNEDNSRFPNTKVVGGVDFVGSKYNAGSDVFAQRIPIKDNNPMDEGGHGTHVAGTVAGIGDGAISYNGVAGSGLLYALKVFGSDGSTSDEVVISALEYAADPNSDENLDDRLDVVNLSLGSSFGSPKIFYNLAIKNLTLGGTVVVCSAGNSGDINYIVGAPSVSDEALSVAASVDSMDHNWKFKAVSIALADKTEIDVEAVESSMTKPISFIESAQGKFVFVGTANKDFTEEESKTIKGNVVLVDRGEVTFAEKIKRAATAGAIGVVVINNQDGDAFGMGGDGKFDIPAIMITKVLGMKIKESMKTGDVVINFKVDKVIEKASLIDTVTDFSSRGPRSEDSIIKPEISAPGQNIISAGMGMGKQTIQLSGTSMSGPHIAGVMALMKQNYPELSVAELKSVVMGTAKSMVDKDGQAYSISRIGAGRVQIDKALNASIASNTVSLSLGDVRIEKQKKMLQSLVLKNIKPEKLKVTGVFEGHQALSMEPVDVSFEPRAEVPVSLKFTLTSRLLKSSLEEVDGYVKFYQEGKEVFRLPVLAVVRKISGISAGALTVNSTSKIDSDGSLVELSLSNISAQKGKTFPMNLIMTDDRKKDSTQDEFKSKACDLQSVGYKVVGGKLYVGYKLYQQVTTWNLCELSMQIDSDMDGVVDQEIVGSPMDRLDGLPALGKFVTLNIDARMALKIRSDFEKLPDTEKNKRPSYVNAVMDVQEMISFDHSGVAIIIVDLAKLKVSPTGELMVKFATSSMEDYAIESDDFLDQDATQWRKMDVSVKGQSYIFDMLDVELAENQSKILSFSKGQGFADLLLLTPTNRSVLNNLSTDDQSEIVRAKYLQ